VNRFNVADYIGVNYVDIINKNLDNGGKISKLTIKGTDSKKEIKIRTDYADGLTIACETLNYYDGHLQNWSIQFNDQKQFIKIFDRKEFNAICDKKLNSFTEISA
jgi:hypothetical protein